MCSWEAAKLEVGGRHKWKNTSCGKFQWSPNFSSKYDVVAEFIFKWHPWFKKGEKNSSIIQELHFGFYSCLNFIISLPHLKRASARQHGGCAIELAADVLLFSWCNTDVSRRWERTISGRVNVLQGGGKTEEITCRLSERDYPPLR